MVQRSGLKKTRQLVSKGLRLYLVIIPFTLYGTTGIPDFDEYWVQYQLVATFER
jgi:hypothetical protein